jgi:ATP-dependent RNA helicase DDX56/DBP9
VQGTEDGKNRRANTRLVVLNHELPLQSRTHIVEEFNKNVYNILIASDDTEVVGTQESESRPRKKAKKDKEHRDSGVSRGIDFLNVSSMYELHVRHILTSYTNI